MSDYLLDTHTLLWWDSEPEKIGRRALELLRVGSGTFHFSQASVWEIAIKTKLGKLVLPQEMGTWLENAVMGNGFSLIPIGLEAIVKTTTLEAHHGDPFDRILIAQALTRSWTVLGSDAQWDAYGVERIWQ